MTIPAGPRRWPLIEGPRAGQFFGGDRGGSKRSGYEGLVPLHRLITMVNDNEVLVIHIG